MRQPTAIAFLLCAGPLLAACGGVESGDTDAGGIDGSDLVDAAPDAAPAASIADVLDCGTPASAGGLGNGTDLQRVDIDLAAFPSARCNDGTGAMYFFRPATSAAGRNRWVIQLQGGGSCSQPDTCAQRWCSVDTNFGMTQMTASLAPMRGTIGDGILRQGGALGEANPVGDWNHVFVRYCSSDAWSGAAGPVDVDARHPVTGAPVRFRIEFNGSHIVDAVIATMRRDGAAPPAYTIAGGSVDLPDLDAAAMVLLAGASAGSGGVTHNADRLREALLVHNPALAMWALHDSGTPPAISGLDFSTTTVCRDLGLCDYQAFVVATIPRLWSGRSDTSCVTWHEVNDPANLFRCGDDDHVAMHHVVTPMMVRMGQTDALISGNFVEMMFTVPGRGLMTSALFAEGVRTQMAQLPQSMGTAEEPALRPAPRYSPGCAKHETLSSDESVFGVTVTSTGAPRTMFDILIAAVAGTTPTAAIWSPGDPVDCM